MGLSKIFRDLSMFRASTRVFVADRREDVLGLRMEFDLDEFARLRRTMKVPARLVYNIMFSAVDPENDDIQGSFIPVTADFTVWDLKLPVPDNLSYDSEALEEINSNLATLVRYTVHAHSLYVLFESSAVLSAAFEAIQGLLAEDAKYRTGLAKGLRVLVPSDSPAEIELERDTDGTRYRTSKTHSAD